MRDDVELTVHRVPVLDTGIGREAGYEDDAALAAAAEVERAAMSPEARALADRIDAEVERRMLFGP